MLIKSNLVKNNTGENTSKKVILFIHRYPLDLVISTAPQTKMLLKTLSKKYYIYYISFSSRKNRSSSELKFSNLENIKIPISLSRGEPLFFLKSILFPLLLMPFLIKLKMSQQNIVLTHCDDALPYYYYTVKKILNTKITYRMGDYMIGYLVDPDKSLLHRILHNILYSTQRRMLSKLDLIIVISNELYKYLIKSGISSVNISVVPESIDIEIIKHLNLLNKNNRYLMQLRNKLGLTKKDLILVFHGSMVPWKNLDVILKAFSLVIKEKPSSKLLIIGYGPLFNQIRKLSINLRLKNYVIFTGWLPYRETLEYVMISDIGVVARKKILANQFILTTALLQYLALGKPALAPDLLAIKELYKNFNLEKLLIYNPNDPHDLATKIIKIIDNLNHVKKIIQSYVRPYIISKFSSEVIAMLESDILLEILNSDNIIDKILY